MNNKAIFKSKIWLSLVFVVGLGFIISAIALTGQNKNINIILEYKSGTIFDPDDNGIETIGNLIDITVENSAFNFGVDYNKVCTKWDIQSNNKKTTLCYRDWQWWKSISLYLWYNY